MEIDFICDGMVVNGVVLPWMVGKCDRPPEVTLSIEGWTIFRWALQNPALPSEEFLTLVPIGAQGNPFF